MDALTTPAHPCAYRAFVSYSHADTAAARWVQKAVESYRVPRQLRRAAARPLPERLYPVYRDRLDMRVGQDLHGSLLEALTDSDALIVVCSPAAAKSPWVDLEIRTFIACHPASPVLAVIAAGAPGEGPEACFPVALLERRDASGGKIEGMREPVAADLRPGGDGKRMARLKLVAGLIDIDLVQLARRDDQRRVRRAALLATAAVIVAALLAVALVRAVQAQREAERQRAAAEGLVEFMVGDLRTRLDPLGKLSILDAVGGRALRYYQGQELGKLQPASLTRRARVLRLLGEIQETQGNFLAASTNYRAAADSTARVLALAPNDPDRIFEHAQSVYYLGSVALSQHELADAETAFRRYRVLAERLARIEPGTPRSNGEITYASSNLASALLERGRAGEAEAAFRPVLASSEATARGAPDDEQAQLDLAQARSWIADALARRGEYGAALAERDGELALYAERARRGSTSKRIEYYRLTASLARARLLGKLGRLPEGIALANRTLHSAVELSASDRQNSQWAELAVITHVALAGLLADAGRIDEAAGALADVAEATAALPPAMGTPQQAKADILSARLLALRRQPERSLATARRAMDALGATAEEEEPRDTRLIRAQAMLAYGQALAALGRTDEARRTFGAIGPSIDDSRDDVELRAVAERAAKP